MDDLLVRELIMNLVFERRKVELKFEEPTIHNLLRFNSLIKQEKYVSAVKLVIPDIEEKDFLSNPIGILNGIKNLIYGEQKKLTGGKSSDDDEAGFFPSMIDMMGNRYGEIPTELIKKMTFTQLIICAKGYEWNMNIQNGEEKKNIRILLEAEGGEEQFEKDVEQMQKDREFFKKHGSLIK